MKKSELKNLIKPIVKECVKESIHEALFESGIVTQVVAEVIKGVNIPQLVESMAPRTQTTEIFEEKRPTKKMLNVMKGGSGDAEVELQSRRLEHRSELMENRKKLEESLGNSLGINIFEGTTPILPETNEKSPMSGVDPGDPGVNLASIPGLKTLDFSEHIKE